MTVRNPVYNEPLFPLPWMIPDRSSPSKGPLRALDGFRADPGGKARGNWGFGPCPGRKGTFGHTSALSRSGGAESPAGP